MSISLTRATVPFLALLLTSCGESADDGLLFNSLTAHTARLEAGYNDSSAAKKPNPIDLYYVIDVTESMSNEIDQIKSNLYSFASNLKQAVADIKFGAVAFRDSIASTQPLTNDLGQFSSYLNSLIASGGGDGNEAALQAIQHAINRLDLEDSDPESIKAIFVFTDNPGHNGDVMPRNCSIDDTVAAFKNRNQALLGPINFFYSVSNVNNQFVCSGYPKAPQQMQALVAASGFPNTNNVLSWPITQESLAALQDGLISLPSPTPVVCLARSASFNLDGQPEQTWQAERIADVFDAFQKNLSLEIPVLSAFDYSAVKGQLTYCCLPKDDASAGDFSSCVDQPPKAMQIDVTAH